MLSLLGKSPEWAEHFDPSKNGGLTITDSVGKSRKIWFKCENGHSFNRTIRARAPRYACPMCKSIAYKHKDGFMKDWDWKANTKLGLDPTVLTSGVNKKAAFICFTCKHSWMAMIYIRAEHGCPACKGTTCTEERNFAQVFPQLLEVWDYEINNKAGLFPDKIMPRTHKEAAWKCSCGFRWYAPVSRQTTCLLARAGKPWSMKRHKRQRCEASYGCPACSGKIATKDNNLAVHCPEVAAEWDESNKDRPEDVHYGSMMIRTWKCQSCNHRWDTTINHRTKPLSTGCPHCSLYKREKYMGTVLKDLGLTYKSQVRLHYPDGTHTVVDYIVTHNKRRLVIEIDGEQHFHKSSIFNKKQGEGAFKAVVARDRKQDAFCVARGDHVLRIPYTVAIDTFKTHIQAGLKRLEDISTGYAVYIDKDIYKEVAAQNARSSLKPTVELGFHPDE